MKISPEQVAHVATLARLELSEEQSQEFTRQLNDILVHVDKLNELDTEGVEPTFHASLQGEAVRPDEVHPSQELDKTLSNAPKHNSESFVVPRVI